MKILPSFYRLCLATILVATAGCATQNHDPFPRDMLSMSTEDPQLTPTDSPSLVTVEAQFVLFRMDDVEKVATRDGRVTSDSLLELRKVGTSRLLYAPQLTVLDGEYASSKSVKEYVYPTDFEMTTNKTVNAIGSGPPIPGDFQTREIGYFFSARARISPNGKLIFLYLDPQAVSEPEIMKYGMISFGKEVVPIEQPIFSSQSLTTTIAIEDGQTLLFGGGLISKDRSEIMYIFVRADITRLTNTPGK